MSAGEAWDHLEKVPPDLRGCCMVGLFLQSFALAEAALNHVIEAALGLNIIQGTTLTKNIDIRRKLNIAQVLANFRNFDKKRIKETIGKLHGLADERNMVAHDLFVEVDGLMGVRFLSVDARSELKFPHITWTLEDLVDKLDALSEIRKGLEEIAKGIKPVSPLEAVLQQAAAPDGTILNNALAAIFKDSDMSPTESPSREAEPE